MAREQGTKLQCRAAAVFVMLVGGLVCASSLLGVPEFTRLVPESSTVRFNTGLCFLLGGSGLQLSIGRHPRWALTVIVPMLLLAGMTLLEHLLGRSMAIDQLFVAGQTPPYPGRMAPNTAVAMLVAGLGLATLAPGHSRIWALSISAMLAALAAALGGVAVLGYAFDLTAAFEWAGLTRMALLTAITSVVLGCGIILATREVGRIASWNELPWLASSVGVGVAVLGLLASHALAEALGLPARVTMGLDAAAVMFAVLTAGTVAQARHMRLLTLQLATARQVLLDSEQRLQVLIDHVQTAIVVHAGDSSIEFANPSAATLLGLSQEQMLGRKSIDPAWHFVREDGSPMPVDEYPVSRVIRARQPVRDYVVGIHVAESEPIRWALVDAVPAIGQDGRLRQVIVSFVDISERQQQKLQLEQLASTDTLTGLATRRRLHELARHGLARARRSGRPLAMVILDVDHFKLINDRFGHETGDRVLFGLAKLVLGQLREVDIAARWGGEEFCLLLPDTTQQAALDVAERLRARIEAMTMFAPNGTPLRVTASFGAAVSTPDDYDLHRLVEAADQAMYQAKREGRNLVRAAPLLPLDTDDDQLRV